MKKKFMLVPMLALSATALVSCGGKKKDANVMFYVPDDTSALAVAKIMDNGFEYDGKKLEFKVVSSSSIGEALENKKCDCDRVADWIISTGYQVETSIENLVEMIIAHVESEREGLLYRNFDIDDIKEYVENSGGLREFDYYC